MTIDSPGEAALAWLERRQRRLGRPLRVLHIGNIANNGFNNARIQRAHGIAADVLSFDYYHIMATPEWEEASFDKAPADAFFPDWDAVDLKGYRRPRWFASGPLEDCCRYLAAEIQGDADADRLWQVLARERFVRCSRSRKARLGLFRRKIGWKLAYERRKLDRRLGRNADVPERAALAAGGAGFEELNRVWQERRHGRPFPACRDDLDYYWERFTHFARLMPHYDVIQGYALDGIWPLLAGRRYCAYEHGTLRSLPFEDHPTGRMAALAFGLADQVLVTNLDCLAAADRLGIGAERIVALPHAFDDQRLRDFALAHRELAPPRERLRLFMPARQDWRDGDPNLSKGNDRFFRAVAGLAREGIACEIVAVRWGRDLGASEALIAELGLKAQVSWVDPMQKPELWRHYLTSHVVVDQFALPAFGGVTFEALALGRRVLTALDVAAAQRFFGEAPPLLVASSVEEITVALRKVAADRDDRAKLGALGASWIARFHAAPRIVALQAQAYRTLLGEAT
ncbi:hypothetical protein [Bosea sp. (in: a-proteobacteria)]|uniref:hypothetical protein n=1 Tax=Bosea sp. (in: a-proteobacteria) TaxID=1871050 RepID=UPI00260E9859|nr:hypothetical protein [Bosea sp. (in: a-proteobacteria)]MCO5090668.1 hypothetical protein [Bosea sp. (in: a-proteobacteria)]